MLRPYHPVTPWFCLVAFLALATAGCGGSAGKQEDSAADAKHYVQVFEPARTSMFSAVGQWNTCGSDHQACRNALMRIEVATTSFGTLHWTVVAGRQSPVTVPPCLALADQQVTQATADYRGGTAAGFRVFEEGDSQLLSTAERLISSATSHLQSAEGLVKAARCGTSGTDHP